MNQQRKTDILMVHKHLMLTVGCLSELLIKISQLFLVEFSLVCCKKLQLLCLQKILYWMFVTFSLLLPSYLVLPQFLSFPLLPSSGVG